MPTPEVRSDRDKVSQAPDPSDPDERVAGRGGSLMNNTAKAGPTRSEIFHEVRGLLAEVRRYIPNDCLGAEQCLDEAVLMLTILSVEPTQAIGLVAGGLAPWQVLRVKALIEGRLAERLSLGDLAAAVRLSKTHFAKAFRKSFGDSPHVHLMKQRIVRAKHLMTTTGDHLAEIALACGLSDQAHLSRTFRRLEGDSPNAWRRRSRLPVGLGRIERHGLSQDQFAS
jgi:AraC family transcriptional regulator